MLSFATTTANAMLTGLRDSLNSGSMVTYGGVVPYNADTALSGNTPSVTMTLSNPSGTVTNKELTLSLTSSIYTVATANHYFFRIYSNDQNIVIQGEVGLMQTDFELLINNFSFNTNLGTQPDGEFLFLSGFISLP